jgi:sortase A
MRGLRRFIAYLLIGGGLVLIADAAITFVWQEPVSALIAKHEQSKLGHQLVGLERQSAADSRQVGPSPRRMAELARREARRVGEGHALGRIRLPTLHRSYVMVQGTDSSSLHKGPGHYLGTALPGQPGTVAVAGHRTTYLAPFRSIDKLRPGDALVLQMPYGRFTYRVQTTRIVKPDAVWVTHNAGYQRLVLSACHPLYSAAKRIVVFARLASATSSAPA